MSRKFLINGHHDANLTPWDRGLAYGDGIFRTLPVRNGQVHCWDRHYRKLCEDCKALGIVCPPEELLAQDIAILMEGDEDATIKIIITRGESARGYAVPALAQPTRIVMRSPAADYPPGHALDGVALFLCDLRLSHQPRLAGIKHLNRLENVLARMEWVDPHYADGLLLDIDNRVIECTISNIFMRSGNTLSTPDLSRCGVAGVTRDRVLELAPTLGYLTQVCDIPLQQLLEAEEVVICNSLFGSWQVRQLQNKQWPPGKLATTLNQYLVIDDTRAY